MVAFKRAVCMGVAAALLVTLFPSVVPLASADAPLWTVTGAGAASAVAELGGKVVDDYGAFVSARAPAEVAQTLRVGGFGVAPLPTTTGRGSYHFEPAMGDGIVPAPWRSDDSAYSIVAFRGPVKQAWREAVLEHADIYDYLPHNTFLVKGDAAALARLDGVRFVGAYHAGYRVAPELGEAQGLVRLMVLVFPDEDIRTAVQAVRAAGATILDVGMVAGWDGIIKAEAPASSLRTLAHIDAVSWIEPLLGGATLDNEKATGLVQTGSGADRRVNDLGVDGSSQVVSICDTGVDTTGTAGSAQMVHEMFHDPANPTVTYQAANPSHRKVVLYYSPVEGGTTKGDFDDGDSHGTHTGGTIAGDAPGYNAYNLHDSGAFAAKMAICDLVIGTAFQIPADYTTMWDPAYAVGARINSNSWGSPHNNGYTAVARQHDAYAWTHRDFVILRSAGNTGPGGQIRPEAIAKDVLAVASSINEDSGNPESLSASSSRGPAADGRVKPDLTAPGQSLISASRSANGYASNQGTSMSTPTVSAAAALVRDYFAKGYYPGGAAGTGPSLNPSNALVRAVLFAGGHEMTGPGSHAGVYNPTFANAIGTAVPAVALGAVNGYVLSNLPNAPAWTMPNGNVGWGRVKLDAALQFAGDAEKLYAVDEGAGLATGGQQSFTVTVANGNVPLRVMVVWTDQPGAAGANPALVNDLDLAVTAPDGTAYQGNNFLGDDSISAGLPDRINIAEKVALGAPEAGTYTITVTGNNVPNGPQPFALVVVGGLA